MREKLLIIFVLSLSGLVALKRVSAIDLATRSTVSPSPHAEVRPRPRILSELEETKVYAQEIIRPDTPVRLSIPAISLEADIFPVGLTSAKIVDTPANDVGWYVDGAKPGETGSAVLNGHVTGIFNKLSFLKEGDEITVDDGKNQHFKFKVTKNEVVNVEDFPIVGVYGWTEKATLKLVTCAGNYDVSRSDFSQRTIIYAQLVR